MADTKGKFRKITAIFLVLILLVIALLSALQIGCVYTERSWSHFRPQYAKQDITALLEKESLSDEDYETLYRQTGLTKLGVDDMRGAGLREKIMGLQDFFFKDREVMFENYAPFAYMENIHVRAPMVPLEDGDIIVTAASRFSWWRFGHSGLVVDGWQRQTVESISPNSVSRIEPADDFATRANFMILRPKVDEETKKQVVEYAKTQLVGLEYCLTVGVLSPKYTEELEKTHCAHLIWYAYKKFGWDLDSNGGGIVTPQDIANSPHVEVVQVYGFDLDALWSK